MDHGYSEVFNRRQMMESLVAIEVGDECGLIFPQELLDSLQVGLGDEVHLNETENGFLLHSNRSDVQYFLRRGVQNGIQT
jgi:hypothetical protein